MKFQGNVRFTLRGHRYFSGRRSRMLASHRRPAHVAVVLVEAWAAQCSYCEQRAAHASPPPGQTAFEAQAPARSEVNHQQAVTKRHKLSHSANLMLPWSETGSQGPHTRLARTPATGRPATPHGRPPKRHTKRSWRSPDDVDDCLNGGLLRPVSTHALLKDHTK
jgi:hypothetical protein